MILSHVSKTSSEKIIAPRDASFQEFICTLLRKSGLKKKYIDKMTNESGMTVYNKVFTHVSIDQEDNYEFFEILGDSTCNKIIVWYIKDRFPVLQNTAGVKVIARLRINLVSKKNFSSLAQKLGFTEFISCEKDILEQKNKSVLEDVFEAFFGATEYLLDSLVHAGAGYGICYRLLCKIFDDLPMSLRYEDLYDPITRLKETFDFYRANIPGRQCPDIWGVMSFENVKTENGQRVFLYQIDKLTRKKILMSTSEAPLLDDAKQMAALNVLNMLEKNGYKRPISEYYNYICTFSG
jgi:hypothetical protein